MLIYYHGSIVKYTDLVKYNNGTIVTQIEKLPKKMNKFIYVILILFFTIIIYALFNNGFPLFFNGSQKDIVPFYDKSNPIITPLASIDFTSGGSCAYLILSTQDIKELPAEMKKSKVFYCDDTNILQRFKNNFQFQQSNRDMATVESRIIIYNNKKVVFSSNIVLTDHLIGFQSSHFGWITPLHKEDIKECFLKFKPLHRAVIYFGSVGFVHEKRITSL